MTDKQIKIDGMDCRYWFRPNPTDCRKCSLRGQDDNCDEIKDCFVKELLGKLTLKEQECERLKLDLIEARAHGDYLNNSALNETLKIVSEQCNQLKAENDELKEKVKELRQGWINCDNKRNLQEANSEFRQRVINRYKQALIEIEEIAENMNKECFYNDFDCEDCDMKNGCTYQGRLKILQKINEAIK